MQIKSVLLAAGLAVASAHQGAQQFTQNQQQLQQVGKVFTHEYVQPNAEETCFSVRPIAACDDQHVATYVKHQKVGFHCINKNSPIAKQFQREADQDQLLPLENKTQDVQAYVEVPVRCERINSEEKRLRKETEKTSEQKIHLIQQQDGEEESFLFEHKPWTKSVEEQQTQEQERQYQRHLIRKQQRQQNKHQLKNQQNIDDESDDELSVVEDLEMNQYGELINKQTSMHRILKMSDEQFDRLMEHLKFIAHQSRRSDKWSQQLDQVIPQVYSKVAKQFFETVLEKQTTSQQEKEELYEQYKEVAKRVYAYVVKQVLQMKNLNQVNQQITGQGNHQQQQYIANNIARNLWYKIQRELTQKQVEEVRQIAENVQSQKPTLDRMLQDETLVVLNKQQMKQLEKDLTKTLVAGLKMVNHNIAKNQIKSEEYQKFHGDEFETEFRTQYPKLYQRLSTIENVQQWN